MTRPFFKTGSWAVEYFSLVTRMFLSFWQLQVILFGFGSGDVLEFLSDDHSFGFMSGYLWFLSDGHTFWIFVRGCFGDFFRWLYFNIFWGFRSGDSSIFVTWPHFSFCVLRWYFSSHHNIFRSVVRSFFLQMALFSLVSCHKFEKS